MLGKLSVLPIVIRACHNTMKFKTTFHQKCLWMNIDNMLLTCFSVVLLSCTAPLFKPFDLHTSNAS